MKLRRCLEKPQGHHAGTTTRTTRSCIKRYVGGVLWRACYVGVRFREGLWYVRLGAVWSTVRWYGTYGGVRCQVRYGAVVRYDGTMVQCIAPTVPLHRTTLVYPKIRCEKCKIGCRKCKIGGETWEIGCEDFQNFGTVYPCAVPPYRSTDCTVPFFPLYRTSVHIVPYQCAQCTMPACVLYLCSLLYTPSSVRRQLLV